MNEVIYLLQIENTENEIGDPLRIPKKIKRYAEKLEIGQKEFYQAATTSLKPEIKFAIWKYEYNDEMFLEYKERNYKIIKTYERKTDEKIELTATSVTNKEVNAYVDSESNKNQ
jgi:hypothetical protein|nr:MAG TPA: head closure knob [Caudoviricetes sp.]